VSKRKSDLILPWSELVAWGHRARGETKDLKTKSGGRTVVIDGQPVGGARCKCGNPTHSGGRVKDTARADPAPKPRKLEPPSEWHLLVSDFARRIAAKLLHLDPVPGIEWVETESFRTKGYTHRGGRTIYLGHHISLDETIEATLHESEHIAQGFLPLSSERREELATEFGKSWAEAVKGCGGAVGWDVAAVRIDRDREGPSRSDPASEAPPEGTVVLYTKSASAYQRGRHRWHRLPRKHART
jgi:hypothetical protein